MELRWWNLSLHPLESWRFHLSLHYSCNKMCNFFGIYETSNYYILNAVVDLLLKNVINKSSCGTCSNFPINKFLWFWYTLGYIISLGDAWKGSSLPIQIGLTTRDSIIPFAYVILMFLPTWLLKSSIPTLFYKN